ncbi:GNAT family N-acetyltransferase [Streptomyces sp. NPDC047014]|uniref:GNAT family N-acetyltransferase n=1 Tax=Streptomyces sp. NPDC047014 TaxID=3155736 RepID=UPI003405FA75
MHFTDRQGRTVVLDEITDENWRAVADVAPADDQRRFVAALGARYLLLSMRGGLWNSLAVRAGEVVVGHVMWAYDEEGGAHWIGGMIIDAAEQGRGVGRAAISALIARLTALPSCREIRLSYHPRNTPAAHLYTTLGFAPTGDAEDEELVAALPLR